jgi:tetratricopeptide (TPR) repeat protein
LVNRFVAETAFARAVSLSRAGADPSGVIGELEYASSRYSWSDAYERSLSVAFLNQATSRAGEFAAKQDASSAAREEVSSLVASSVNAAKRATELGPDDVLNWAGRGTVYRDVMGSVPNAEDFAAASFKQAALFEPANPSHLVDLARVYLMVADRARSMSGSDDSAVVQAAKRAEIDQLAAAEKALQAAIDLKRDYAPAYYYLAATLERQGRLDEAASRIAGLRDANPNDVSLGFQLAMLYLRGGHDDLATVELERVLSINPNHSNALWYLSALYERAGDLEQAIRLAERVAELNPDNAAVRQRVEQLKAGKAAAEIPVPIEEEIIE